MICDPPHSFSLAFHCTNLPRDNTLITRGEHPHLSLAVIQPGQLWHRCSRRTAQRKVRAVHRQAVSQHRVLRAIVSEFLILDCPVVLTCIMHSCCCVVGFSRRKYFSEHTLWRFSEYTLWWFSECTLWQFSEYTLWQFSTTVSTTAPSQVQH